MDLYLCPYPRLDHSTQTISLSTVRRNTEISFNVRRWYNNRATFFGEIHRKDVWHMDLRRFIEAVGAGVVGHYVCELADAVVKLIIDWLI